MGIINFFIALFFGALLPQHDYYLSTTDIKYVPEKNQIQFTSRFFIDDIEALMQHEGQANVQFQPDNDPSAIDAFTKTFYNKNFTLRLDGEAQQIHYLGREYQEDVLVVYAEIQTSTMPPKEVFFEVQFLIDFLPGQQNIIHFSTPEINKSILLNNSKTSYRILL